MPTKLQSREPLAEWKKSLVIAVSGLFVFEVLTGLVIFLGPFTLFSQFSVLTHTVVGIIWVVPYVTYQVSHWLGVRDQRLSHLKLLGYATWIVFSICAISGLVLTVQGAWGMRIGYNWRLTHNISSFAAIGFLAFHILTVALAHRKEVPREGGLAVGGRVRQYLFGSAAWASSMLALTVFLTMAYQPVDTSYEFPKDYSYRYGKDRPFAPSLVKTSHGGAIHPRALAESARCGSKGCHVEIYKEWLPSAHRYASMDIAFQAIQKVMATNEGAEATRYCAGCHDPIALFSGSKNIYNVDLSSFGADEGVSCSVCHSISKSDVKGNANYTIEAPVRYAYELKEGAMVKPISDFLIRVYPQHHIASYKKDLYKTPEYCASCHKQFIDQEINKVGWVQLQNQYDNWKASHWNTGREGEMILTCRECHMPLQMASLDPARGDSQDYNRDSNDKKHRSHRFLGGNQFVPTIHKLEGWKEHVALTEKWLQGAIPIPEIKDKWSAGPAIDLRIEAPEEIQEGSELSYKVIVRSNKVGHDFPTGPLDIIQAWVDTKVIAPDGKVIYRSGKLDKNNFLEKKTFVFKAEGIDKEGNLIDRHNLWEMVGARFKRALFPGLSDVASFDLLCPELSSSERGKIIGRDEVHRTKIATQENTLQIKATLRYRKVAQYLLNYMFGQEAGLTAPITDMTSVEKSVRIMVRSN